MSLAGQINNQPEARAKEALGWHICTTYSAEGVWVDRIDNGKRRPATQADIEKWEKTIKWYAEGRKADQP